jgi:squalene synthase HpnC
MTPAVQAPGAHRAAHSETVRPEILDKARHENFPVALRALPRSKRQHLEALYTYARWVDDLGDAFAGDRVAALREVAADVDRLYDHGDAELAPVAGLATLVRECRVPRDRFLALVEANLADQEVTRYETFEDLLGYCTLSADPVGAVVLHVFGYADPDRLALSDRICTGLQLLEHWQDVAEDHRAGRVYLPQEDLRRFEVTDDMLAAGSASPELAALLRFETDRALAWLNSGAYLVSTLHGWARVAVSGYVAGGRAAGAALRAAGHDSLSSVPKPSAAGVLGAWIGGMVRRPG